MTTFLVCLYTKHREQLVRYAFLYVRDQDRAEDLVEASHDKLCQTYGATDPSETDYLKLMKTTIYHHQIDQARKIKRMTEPRFPESVSPKPLPSLEEHVCRRDEMELLMLAMARLGEKDRDILLERGDVSSVTANQRYQAKGRLQQKLIEVLQFRQVGKKPQCPACQSLSLYFHLSECVWVCENCGQVTKTPTQEGKK